MPQGRHPFHMAVECLRRWRDRIVTSLQRSSKATHDTLEAGDMMFSRSHHERIRQAGKVMALQPRARFARRCCPT